MTRLLAVLMIVAGLSHPALAQQQAPDADAAAPGAAPAGQQDEDDDDDDEAPAAASEGAFEAKGKYDFGFAGLLARDNRSDLAPLTLASGQPVAQGEYTLASGGYYRIEITADGSQELALSGGDFFRAIWVNEVVIDDIEIRPMGLHSLEFDDAGTASISFVAVVPGRYTLSIPGSHGETQQAVFNIR